MHICGYLQENHLPSPQLASMSKSWEPGEGDSGSLSCSAHRVPTSPKSKSHLLLNVNWTPATKLPECQGTEKSHSWDTWNPLPAWSPFSETTAINIKICLSNTSAAPFFLPYPAAHCWNLTHTLHHSFATPGSPWGYRETCIRCQPEPGIELIPQVHSLTNGQSQMLNESSKSPFGRQITACQAKFWCKCPLWWPNSINMSWGWIFPFSCTPANLSLLFFGSHFSKLRDLQVTPCLKLCGIEQKLYSLSCKRKQSIWKEWKWISLDTINTKVIFNLDKNSLLACTCQLLIGSYIPYTLRFKSNYNIPTINHTLKDCHSDRAGRAATCNAGSPSGPWCSRPSCSTSNSALC